MKSPRLLLIVLALAVSITSVLVRCSRAQEIIVTYDSRNAGLAQTPDHGEEWQSATQSGYRGTNPVKNELIKNDKESYTITATVSAYNTVPWQTDDDYCIAASGSNICGRSDVAACPIYLPFGTVIAVSGKNYICLDRMAKRYREHNRFDLSFDKDIQGAKQWGVRELEVIIYK